MDRQHSYVLEFHLRRSLGEEEFEQLSNTIYENPKTFLADPIVGTREGVDYIELTVRASSFRKALDTTEFILTHEIFEDDNCSYTLSPDTVLKYIDHIETLEDYTYFANRTAVFPEEPSHRTDFEGRIIPFSLYPYIKLSGETGETLEKIGKAIRKGEHVSSDALVKELGDVLWYVSACGYELGYNLKEVAQTNLKKLYDRQKRNKIVGEGDER